MKKHLDTYTGHYITVSRTELESGSRKDLTMFSIPPPWGTEDGLGVIRRGTQELFDK